MKIETITQLILAIIQVESSGNDMAVGDNGKAYGAMQMHAIYVDDVNRISAYKYKHEDAFDRGLAIEMFFLYTKHYATEERLGREPTMEDIARIHNGGPDGWKKESTVPYWNKILQAHSKIQPLTNKSLGAGVSTYIY